MNIFDVCDDSESEIIYVVNVSPTSTTAFLYEYVTNYYSLVNSAPGHAVFHLQGVTAVVHGC